ncbi:MAG TPA: hypothetical protein VI039_13180 [Solirubrobacterales bacterium]
MKAAAVRPCNDLAEKRCYECGRCGVKAFQKVRRRVGFHEIEVWRCRSRGACGPFDIQVGLEEYMAAYEQAKAAGSVSSTTNEAGQTELLGEKP